MILIISLIELLQAKIHILMPFKFVSTSLILVCCAFLLPFVGCSIHEEMNQSSTNHKKIKDGFHKLSPQMKSDIRQHGLLLWAAIGFLMPLGILTIRMSYKEQGRRRKILFYLHLVFQMLSVLLATAGAILSIRSFENSFDNHHQKIGLVLYCAIWVQTAIGFLRPRRGNSRRSSWYFLHWILGTMISLVGIINIYTGLKAYKRRTLASSSSSLYTILFTAQVCFMAFFYLFQDKWDYIQKQRVIAGSNDDVEAVTPSDPVILQTDSNNQKVLILPELCPKRNALRNLFD